jgi:hypothetical protein
LDGDGVTRALSESSSEINRLKIPAALDSTMLRKRVQINEPCTGCLVALVEYPDDRDLRHPNRPLPSCSPNTGSRTKNLLSVPLSPLIANNAAFLPICAFT